MGRGRSLPSANPDNVAADGAIDAECGRGGGGGGGRRAGVGQITAYGNSYSSFSSSSFPLCVRRGFDEKFCFQQCCTAFVFKFMSFKIKHGGPNVLVLA